MELGTIIAGAVLIALCAIPLTYMYLNVKRREKKMLNLINTMAEKDGCHITISNVSGDFVIGMDETANVLYVVSRMKDHERRNQVNLNEVKACQLNRVDRVVKNQEGQTTMIEKLELLLTTKDATTEAVEFYHMDLSSQLYDELTLIQKWYQIVCSRIAKVEHA
ncbi:MAG: hypothetical protein A3D92_08405 [Bacteroidetes bacterium RIFCSPHIGHO2_02_FULL_44_7]|nr:MAG: hypothetical protein A3D92_08405 [Bacteroidetes bacterium RIFCSPHIGHO2_02_FULL_44_7]